MPKQKIILFILLLLSFSIFIHCGTDNYTPSDGESVPVMSNDTSDTASPSLCVIENDCDNDGVYTSCDDDDNDVANTAIKDGCDGDADGFVDVYCVDETLSRDTNADGLISADERDVNCDTCPGTSDPLQTDSDDDGYGDACGIAADINISDEAPTEDETVDNTSTTETQENSIEGSVAVALIDSESSVRQSTLFDVTIELTNNTNQENFVVQVLLQFASSTTASSATSLPTTVESLTLVGSCTGTTAKCTTLGEDEITLGVGSTLTLETSHSIPKDLDIGRYTVRIQVIYVNEDGSEIIVGRNGGVLPSLSSSSIQVTEGWSLGAPTISYP